MRLSIPIWDDDVQSLDVLHINAPFAICPNSSGPEGFIHLPISDRKLRSHAVRLSRHNAGQNIDHGGPIDILSGHDEADSASLHPGALLHERRERGSAGAL